VASAPRFSWSHLAFVVLGGTVGTAARAGLLLIEAPEWQAFAVPAINLIGALLLGLVTGLLMHRGQTPAIGASRLFFGTGVLGGFTTYSTFAVQSVQGVAAWLTIVTAVAGVLAAMLGVALGRLLAGVRR
jgi:CrcB protein